MAFTITMCLMKVASDSDDDEMEYLQWQEEFQNKKAN